jgi:hypothetical protein
MPLNEADTRAELIDPKLKALAGITDYKQVKAVAIK